MSRFKSFRIGSNLFDDNEIEFYFKVKNDQGYILGNFLLAEDGLYYYRRGSHVLTPQENEQTRSTYDGFISFEELKEQFDKD